ncbi:hypothetical protein GKZ68_10300 [Hymenobacter sp. BRD128]|uniref:hypothetical protein n=1 Tax=Hymenobacter sp. BRD128 TaxID=2675878 RepID=UPI00156598F0|nr:hypothetical protein [Hymenobacter sp. BRD128]QKG56981.1 hypothetical protein GKZ68_10300 [Hymenobacter sp. BRD128]
MLNNRDLKAMTVLYQLKALFVGGVIQDFGQQAQHIAATYGYSISKLRSYVAVLCQMGLLTKPRRGTLVLASSRRIAAHHSLQVRGFHRLPSTQLTDLETRLRALALAENIDRQQYALEQKAITATLVSRGIPMPAHQQPQRLNHLKKTVQVAEAVGALQTRFTQEVATLAFDSRKADFNPFATLSRKGIARALGRHSKATGLRYAKLLTKVQLLTDEPRRVFVCDATKQEYSLMQEGLFGFDYSFRHTRTGKVEKWLSNLLTVNKQNLLY